MTVQFIYLFIIYTDCKGEKKHIHKKRLMCTNYYQSSMNFSVKCFIFPYLFCVVVSVSLQARHPVHPGLSLPSKTRQVSRRPVVATVVGPWAWVSAGRHLASSAANRRRVLTADVDICIICNQNKRNLWFQVWGQNNDTANRHQHRV